MTMPHGRQASVVAVGAGGVVVLLGLLALAGFHAPEAARFQVVRVFVPISYNTALVFVLCGVGLLLNAAGRLRLSAVCGGLASVLGLLTLVQYSLEVDLGIHQIPMQHNSAAQALHPVRMSPSSALSIFLAGAALGVAARFGRQGERPLISAVLASLVAALGSAVTVGHLGRVGAVDVWGQLSCSNVHEAAGILLISGGIFALAWRAEAARGSPRPLWLAIPVGVCSVAFTLALWQALLADDRAHNRRETRAETALVKAQIEAEVESRIRTLIRMAKRWELRGGIPRAEWEADARLQVTDQSGFQAIEWVEPNCPMSRDRCPRALRVGPLEGKEVAQGLDHLFGERLRIVMQKARNRREVTVTRPVDLVGGGKGFLVFVPIFEGKHFGGFVLGVFRARDLFDSLSRLWLKLGYSISVFDGEHELYVSHQADGWHEEQWSQETRIEFRNVSWRVRVQPDPYLLATQQSVLPYVSLGSGLLASVLLSFGIYLAQTGRLRNAQIENVNHQLQHQIEQRKRVEEEMLATNADLEERVAHRTRLLESINQQLGLEVATRTRREGQLQSLASKLALTQEQERRKLAVSLHDCLSQLLVIVKMKLGILSNCADVALRTHFEEIKELIDQAHEEVTSVTFQLSPPVLHDMGFSAAAQWLGEDIEKRYGVQVIAQDDGSAQPMDESVRVTLFRALRELLVNAAKHAQVTKVYVSILHEGKFVRVLVSDDGIGFDQNSVRNDRFGLFSIREELNHLGGDTKIESAPGKGTTVTLVVPCASLQDQAKESST